MADVSVGQFWLGRLGSKTDLWSLFVCPFLCLSSSNDFEVGWLVRNQNFRGSAR